MTKTQTATITIDTRNLPIPTRQQKVSEQLETIAEGEMAEIIADDPRLPDMAPKMLAVIGKGKLIRAWRGEDGFYHALVERDVYLQPRRM
jgi:TusA-related sulfurtransferase